jgi:hypothetical protein
MSPEERYIARSVTGFPITPTTIENGRNTRTKPSTLWYVLDSAYCYRIVAAFTKNVGSRNKVRPEAAAHLLAARLNAEENEWRASL